MTNIDLGGIRGWMGAALLLGAVACGDAEAGGAPEVAGEDTGFVRVINVEVAPVVPGRFVEQVLLTGTVAANRDVTVSAEESGAVTSVLVEKGARVHAGQALLRIDDRVLK
ncbi:MAG TPA: biotin/lipoyl-binding protein, partial [Longimicrobiales bacterium]|nr:biotin/lipoyl-binding protein [Longimicrobiales bacterium]